MSSSKLTHGVFSRISPLVVQLIKITPLLPSAEEVKVVISISILPP